MGDVALDMLCKDLYTAQRVCRFLRGGRGERRRKKGRLCCGKYGESRR